MSNHWDQKDIRLYCSYQNKLLNGPEMLTLKDGRRLAVRDSVGGGVTKVGLINSTPTTRGAFISNDTIYLAEATSTTGGVLSNASQAIAGLKRFQNEINVAKINNLSPGGNLTLFGNSSGSDQGAVVLTAIAVSDSSQSKSYVRIQGTNQTSLPSTATEGYIKFLDIRPTVNQSGTANQATVGINYEPTLTNVLGKHYAALFRSGLVGIGTATPNQINL